MRKLYWLFRKTVQINWSYKLSNLLKFANIFFSIFAFYYIGRLVDKAAIPALNKLSGGYFSFVIFGLAVNSYFNTSKACFNSNLYNEQILGTLEPVLATGTSFPVILAGLSLYDYANLTIQVAAMIALGIIFFGVKLVWSNLLLGLLILLVSILAFIGFGLVSAAFVMAFKRGDPLGWLVGNLSTIISGVYFPVEALPTWLQKLAVLLPITHSLRAIRLVMLKGASFYEVRNEFFALCAFAVILLPFSLFCLRYALKKVSIDGTLPGH